MLNAQKMLPHTLSHVLFQACIGISHSLQHVLYTAWTLITFSFLSLIYTHLWIWELLQSLQITNVWENKTPHSMTKSRGMRAPREMIPGHGEGNGGCFVSAPHWLLCNYNWSTYVEFNWSYMVQNLYLTEFLNLVVQFTDLNNGLHLSCSYYNTICQMIKVFLNQVWLLAAC